MWAVLGRLCGLIGLLVLNGLCWLVMSGVVFTGALIAWPAEPGVLLLAGCVAFGLALYYEGLFEFLLRCSPAVSSRVCFRETLIRTACMSWIPLLTAVVPSLFRVFAGSGALGPGLFVLGAVAGTALSNLTLWARISRVDGDGAGPASPFGRASQSGRSSCED
jgi:hypothetical protein